MRWISLGEKDPGGRLLLRRALTPPERAAMHARRQAIEPFLRTARYGDIRDQVLVLMVHYNIRGMSENETSATASTYARALSDLPLWAIKRACDRFAQNKVEPAEIDVKSIDPSYLPSSGAIHTVARNIVRDLQVEHARIGMVTMGLAPPPPVSDEERKAIGERMLVGVEEAKRALAQRNLDEAAQQAERDVKHRQEMTARNVEDRRRTYIAAGLEPPEGTDFPSLGMMLLQGYRVEEIGHRMVLLAPERRRPEPPPQRPTRGEQKTTARKLSDIHEPQR